MNNLKENCTYLVKFASGDSIFSITILMSTEKAYFIRWNSGIKSNDTWELKSKIEKNYSLVEDISERMNREKNIKDFSKLTYNSSKELCPICHGMGSVPDTNNTAGKISCPLCFGSKFVTNKIKDKF